MQGNVKGSKENYTLWAHSQIFLLLCNTNFITVPPQPIAAAYAEPHDLVHAAKLFISRIHLKLLPSTESLPTQFLHFRFPN